MEDKTSIEIYRVIYDILDKSMTPGNEKIIKELAEDVYASSYNFNLHYRHLNSDHTLEHLGLYETVTKDDAW